MNSLLLNSLIISAWAAVLEFVILRCWYGRWNLAALVLVGAFISAVSWTILWQTFSWGWSVIFNPPPANPYDFGGGSMGIGIFLVVAWISCGITLIPATLT